MFDWFGLPVFGASQAQHLEVIHYPHATSPSGGRPLLFVHGAYAGAWCWEEHFLPYLASLGFDCHAVSLRGHGRSDGHSRLHSHGISDYVDDVRHVVETLPIEPVLIGHSMGGMVIQKYLERYSAPAVVLMAPVPPSGLGGSVLEMMTTDPWLFAEFSLVHGGGTDFLDARTAGRAVFSDDFDAELQLQYASRMQGESQRALFDMTAANLPSPWCMNVPPMLVMGAKDDALFSPAMTQGTAMAYNAELVMLPDMAHAIMLEAEWQRAADALQSWLANEPAAQMPREPAG